tara:strand:- start:379 stop:678 length:300 start_codon:yes stop_codon:yes gene_type:complete
MYSSIFKINIEITTGCKNLKEKRNILKSIFARIRQRFNISISEVSQLKSLTMTTIGIAYITNDSKKNEIIIHEIIKFIEIFRPDLTIVNIISDSIKIEN